MSDFVAGGFPKFDKLAAELQIMVWRESAEDIHPGIHFFNYASGRTHIMPHYEQCDDYQEEMRDNYMVGPWQDRNDEILCMSRSECRIGQGPVNTSRCIELIYHEKITRGPDGFLSVNREDPRSHLYHARINIESPACYLGGIRGLVNACLTSRREVGSVLNKRQIPERSSQLQGPSLSTSYLDHPTWIDIGSAGTSRGGNVLVNVSEDIFCLQVSTPDNPFRVFCHRADDGYFAARVPSFLWVKKVCFEVPPLWYEFHQTFDSYQNINASEENTFPDFLSDCKAWIDMEDVEGNVGSGMLLHFPSITTLYLLDHRIKLVNVQALKENTEVFAASEDGFHYVEVQYSTEAMYAFENGHFVKAYGEAITRDLRPFEQTFSSILDGDEDLDVDVYGKASSLPYTLSTRAQLEEDIATMPGHILARSGIGYIWQCLEAEFKRTSKPVIKLLAKVPSRLLGSELSPVSHKVQPRYREY